MKTIDELGHTAGAQLRTSVSGDDVEARLSDLVHTVQRRRRVKLTSAALGVALLASGLGWGVWNQDQTSSLAPASRLHTGAPGIPPNPNSFDTCAIDLVACTGSTQMTFKMPVVMSWDRPDNFGLSSIGVSSNRSGSTAVAVEAARSDVTAGVNVAQTVRGAAAGPPLRPDHSAPTTARALADWIAERPFLNSSPVTRTTVAGLSAWTVEVTLKHGEAARAVCNDVNQRCAPVMYIDGKRRQPVQGVWKDMTARFIVFDVPDAGATSIWSWTFAGPSSLDGNQPLIDSITFGER